MSNLSIYDILKYAVDHNEQNAWTKCLSVLMRKLEKNPNMTHVNDEDINVDEDFTLDDLKQIWKWMLDDYQYQGKYYRSQLLENDYYKNHSFFDETSKFIQNIPTNSKRSFKYYTGIGKYSIGNKEKQLIKKCLVDFYNYCLGSNYSKPHANELKPLVVMYINAKHKLSKLPPLKQSELIDIFKNTTIPNDISIAIGMYVNAQNDLKKKSTNEQTNNNSKLNNEIEQQAGRKYKKNKRQKTKKIKTKKRNKKSKSRKHI